MPDRTNHPDYEAAFQAAEQAAQTELGCGVDPEPTASPDADGWHTWAFTPLADATTVQRPDLQGTVQRVEVQMEAEDTDGNIPVHFTRGPPREPTIIDTREVGA